MSADAHLPLILRQHRDGVSVLDADDLAGPGPGECWELEQGEEEDGCLGFWH